MKQTFKVGKMSCAACSAFVEKTVSGLSGVLKCQVNLLTEKMEVEYNPEIISQNDIIKAVENGGYTAAVYDGKEDDEGSKELKQFKVRLAWSVSFLAILMYISMGEMIGLPLPSFLLGHENAVMFAGIQLVLLIPIVAVNYKIFVNGFKKLFALAPNMDSLIAIGSGSAIVYGIYALVMLIVGTATNNHEIIKHFHMQLYFESAGTILTLVTLGKFLEFLSKRRTGDAVKGLMELTPEMVTVIKDGKEYSLPPQEVAQGDIVKVKPGESIALDGEIISGSSTVDCSALTGESEPVFVKTGDFVRGGTINLDGGFTFKVTHTRGERLLDQIIELVEKASSTKTGSARIADTISGYFTPVVISIALITGIVWLLLGKDFAFAFQMAISVLVISCPCALGLATPVAIMVGIGRGAEKGILFKSAESVENLSHIKTFVFDKTGTVTVGHPTVTDVLLSKDIDEKELFKVAASLEKMSEHPLSSAIIDYAAKLNVGVEEPENFKVVSGRGIIGTIGKTDCLLGNKSFMSEQKITGSIDESDINDLESQGKTAIYVCKNKELIGIIFAADTVRPKVDELISFLKSREINTVMLTGDRKAVAENVAAKIGFDSVISEVLPTEKEKEIQKLKAKNPVAMVGDGINDAPALCSADVGIAVGSGTDIAIDSADIVLMNSSPKTIIDSVQLSHKIMRNIKTNLFWAFLYNSIGIPIAAGVFSFAGITLSPMIAAAAMSLSSLFVVMNALRLRRA